MKCFLLFVALVTAITDDLNSTLMAIKRLHEKTNYSTFYEVFGVSENASITSIKKLYQKMMKLPSPIPGIEKREDAVALLTEAYNILKNKKSAYDFILSNSYIYIGGKDNFRNNLYVILMSIVAGLLAIDLIHFGIRYLAFMASPKKTPRKKGPKDTKESAPSMMIVSILRSIKSLIKK
ncbi:putative Dnaj domain-containing protein [Encephalitozoon hellem]|uniref:Dnaj domain-containing protein n=1 Tax=Encephalitozoon hellem TaxID=27973 RepID=A0ABY8CL74_ENCHE|nr:putative Dnaj domain-containing protein [Encephalitozoon hellem]